MYYVSTYIFFFFFFSSLLGVPFHSVQPSARSKPKMQASNISFILHSSHRMMTFGKIPRQSIRIIMINYHDKPVVDQSKIVTAGWLPGCLVARLAAQQMCCSSLKTSLVRTTAPNTTSKIEKNFRQMRQGGQMPLAEICL